MTLVPIETTMKAITFTSEELTFIKGWLDSSNSMPLTDLEFKLYIATAQMTGANPILQEIYAIKYKAWDNPDGKMAIVFDHKFLIKKVNEAYGDFQGFTNPEYCKADGTWVDIWPAEVKIDNAPVACRIGIRRKGYVEPAYSTVLWRERVKTKDGKLQRKWASDPIGMLTKCTKVQVLRDNYGSIVGAATYIPEEIDDPEEMKSGEWTKAPDWKQTKERNDRTKEIKAGILDPSAAPISDEDKARLLKIKADLGYDSATFWDSVHEITGHPLTNPDGTKAKLGELTTGEAQKILDYYKAQEATTDEPHDA